MRDHPDGSRMDGNGLVVLVVGLVLCFMGGPIGAHRGAGLGLRARMAGDRALRDVDPGRPSDRRRRGGSRLGPGDPGVPHRGVLHRCDRGRRDRAKLFGVLEHGGMSSSPSCSSPRRPSSSVSRPSGSGEWRWRRPAPSADQVSRSAVWRAHSRTPSASCAFRELPRTQSWPFSCGSRSRWAGGSSNVGTPATRSMPADVGESGHVPPSATRLVADRLTSTGGGARLRRSR